MLLIQKRKKKKEEKEEKEEKEYIPEDYGEVLAAWEFPEYTKIKRNKSWYIFFVIITISVLIYSYFTENPLFAIIIILFTVIYTIIERKEPREAQIIILEDGIIIDNKFIDYKEIKNFYIIYHPPTIKNLYLQPKNQLKPRLALPLEKQNPVEIREILLKYIDEDLEKEEIPTSEGISRLLKL